MTQVKKERDYLGLQFKVLESIIARKAEKIFGLVHHIGSREVREQRGNRAVL